MRFTDLIKMLMIVMSLAVVVTASIIIIINDYQIQRKNIQSQNNCIQELIDIGVQRKNIHTYNDKCYYKKSHFNK